MTLQPNAALMTQVTLDFAWTTAFASSAARLALMNASMSIREWSAVSIFRLLLHLLRLPHHAFHSRLQTKLLRQVVGGRPLAELMT